MSISGLFDLFDLLVKNLSQTFFRRLKLPGKSSFLLKDPQFAPHTLTCGTIVIRFRELLRNKPFRQVAKAPIQLLPVPSKPWKDAQDYLSYAQAQYASDANRTRTFREFGRDDLVLLKRRPGTKFSKFDPPWSGPFRILEKTSAVTYRLQLPEAIRRHPVVYVGLLKPYIAANRDNSQIPDVILPEEPDLSVPVSQFQVPDKTLDKKITRSQAYYLVSICLFTKLPGNLALN